MLLWSGTGASEHDASQIGRCDTQAVRQVLHAHLRQRTVVDAVHGRAAEIALRIVATQPCRWLTWPASRTWLRSGCQRILKSAHVADLRRQGCARAASRLAHRAGVTAVDDDVEEPADLTAVTRGNSAVTLAGVEVHSLMLP